MGLRSRKIHDVLFFSLGRPLYVSIPICYKQGVDAVRSFSGWKFGREVMKRMSMIVSWHTIHIYRDIRGNILGFQSRYEINYGSRKVYMPLTKDTPFGQEDRRRHARP